MTKNAALFGDFSSNNTPPDIAAYAKAGHRVIALKATEDTNYVWSDHARLTREAHAHDLTVMHYHFARPGSATAQALAFLKAVEGLTAPHDGLVVDCEVGGINGRWVTTFLNRVHKAHPNLQLWVYGSPYFLRDHGIRPVHDAKLWLADYATTIAFTPPGWPHYDAWQFTQTGTITGAHGHVDVSRLRTVPAKPKPPAHPKRPPTTPTRWRRWMRWLRWFKGRW